MNEEHLDKAERITIRLFLIIILIWVTLVLYQGCSVMLVKGNNNSLNQETVVDSVVKVDYKREINIIKQKEK